jgi:hypothetical protein
LANRVKKIITGGTAGVAAVAAALSRTLSTARVSACAAQ